ncbi:MAG: GAF domain-containing protein, partial [Desulfovibrio sp.]|nr:GAF domain-containing protein [Desulfovibrio sp.]
MPSRASRIPVLLKALVVETHMALRLRALVGEEPLSIFIADAPLAPAALPDDATPIRHRDALLGHVRGGEKAALVADLLEVLAGMLAEQDALRHRLESVQEEVTRFYDLAAKTAGSDSPAEVCRIVVEEARRLFQGEDVSVSVRLHDADLDLEGARCAAGSAVEPGEQTLSTMMSELMNIQGRVIGAINVASPTPGAFTRTDMRLLRALAAQAAAPIESARHQRRLQRIL